LVVVTFEVFRCRCAFSTYAVQREVSAIVLKKTGKFFKCFDTFTQKRKFSRLNWN